MRFLQTLFASILGTLIALGVLLLLAVLVVVGLIASADSTPAVRRGSVLVVDLSGGLPEVAADDPFQQALGGDKPDVPDLMRLRTALRMAATDSRIDGVWLRVGGMAAPWGTLEEVRDALDRYRASGKPLIASGDGPYHSEADFVLTSAADSVFLPPLSFFECNGFQLETQFLKRGLDRLGVTPVVVRAGTFKAAVEPFLREDMSPENRTQLQALVDAQAASFVRLASARRPQTRPALTACTTGAPLMSAEEAQRQGLVAGLRTRDEVEAALGRRFGVDAAKKLRTIPVGAYARTPASAAGLDAGSDGEIAVVVAEGAIVDGKSGGGGGLLGGGVSVGDETFNAAMRTVREDDDVKAVVLRIASPGGSAVASESMRRAIAATRAKKPVVVSMGDYAASGGYWIATASDAIVAQPNTLTGSIGVFSLFFDARRALADRLGVTVDRVATSEHADIGSLTATPDAVEQAVLQRGVDTTYAAFLRHVARARQMTPAQVDSIGQGRVWTGADGQRIGLVDSLGSLRTAIGIAARRAKLDPDAATLRVLPRPQTFLERLGGSVQASAHAALRTLAASGLSPAERAAVDAARRFDALVDAEGRTLALLPLRLTVR